MQGQRVGAKLSATVALTLILVLGLVRIAAAQNAGAADPPLNFGNNFFVTGDYVVAGAQNLNASLGNDGFGTGTISFPDGNPGIRGTTTVPKGADIVAALLYWQTVEKVGAPGSGQNGFFGPVFNGVPQLYPISGQNLPSHNATSFSDGGCSGFSTGKFVQTYRADVRGYLPLDANGNALVDSADGVKFEVRLPNVGKNTPFTLGASLVIVYRVISPNFPLNVITIYDGGFAANSAPNFTMSQPIQGLVEAGLNGPGGQILGPVSKLTHIVGAGKSNKIQNVFLNGVHNGAPDSAPVQLPSPYGNGNPAFPGHYVNWDNTTWVLPDPTFPGHPNLANPLQVEDDSATAMVVASGANPGCVSWGATIVSTTIRDDDKDGIPPVWKTNKRYTDPATSQVVSLDDPSDEPKAGQQDIFIQMDHVEDANGNFSIPAAPAVSMVKSAFLAHNVHLHITDASKTTGIASANIIHEPACADQPGNLPPYYCPYLNQVGVTSWRYGFEFVKNQPLNYPDEKSCEAAANGPCIRRFPIAQRNSHHYVVIGDTLGAANWTFFAGKLTDSTGNTVPGSGLVQQVQNTVTIYTLYGHGLTADNANHTLPNGRVTISNAITNPNLNGTFFVKSVTCPANPNPNGKPCDLTNTAPGPYSFTIQLASVGTPPPTVCPAGTPAGASCYTVKTDPYLAVFSGQATSGSGLSDIGGAGTLITLGKWGANATLSAYAGTLMHELGHTLGLSLHGGSYYDDLAAAQAIPDYRPTIEPNCKTNYQSVMNYMFQARLLGASVYSISQTSLTNNVATYSFTLVSGSLPQVGQNVNVTGTTNGMNGIFNVVNAPITSVNLTANTFTVSIQKPDVGPAAENANATMVSTVDFSRQQLSALDETNLLGSPITTTDPQIAFHTADWYDPQQTFVIINGQRVALGTAATHHCGDTPLNANDVIHPTYFYSGGTSPLYSSEITIPWSSNTLDANFDGTSPGAAGSEPTKFRGYDDWANVDPRQTGGTGNSLLGPGGLLNSGAGGLFGGPGGLFGGPGGLFGGPGGLFGGPGGLFGGPGGLFGGPGGLFGGPGELDFGNAISVTPPPTQLSASENVSPRTITLTWTEPNFPTTDHNNIYRSPDGVNFSFVASVGGTPPGSQNTFTDTVTCNPNGYTYYITTVVNVNPNINPPQFQESTQSTVSTGQNGQLLTGCYISTANTAATITLPGFSSPTAGQTFTPSDAVNITWTLLDASNSQNVNVANFPTANKALVVIGPLPSPSHDNSCAPLGSVPVFLQSPGSYAGPNPFAPEMPLAGITANNGQFMASWNTGESAAGCYVIELDTDSGQYERVEVQLLIDVNDTDTTPHPNNVGLPPGIVGLAYNNTLTEDGGTPSFSWTSTAGSLPSGITLNPVSGLLSGTTCLAGTYNFTAMVTDAKSNFGTQPLTLQINKANTTTGVTSNANPSVFQQMVTFTVTVAPQFSCTPTGTVTLSDGGIPIASASNLPLSGGMATFTTSALSVGMHTITASYSGDPNFNASNSNAALLQTVNKANTATTISLVSPSPAVVGQSITVTYSLAVVSPGAGSPIPPTGTVTVAASDGSASCMAALLGPVGMCTLSPAPATAGNIPFTVTYSGDGNFLTSVANGNYTVLIFVSDSQPTPPPPFTPTKTLPNAVVGSPYSNTVYEAGGVTAVPNNFLWTIVSGSVMPGGGSTLPGLSLTLAPDGVSGLLSGTPTSAGTFTFTAMVTDSAGNTGTQNLSITVLAPAPAPFGLVSWYPFEGNASDLEKVNNGSVVGTPQFVPAEVDNGLKPGPQPNGNIITIPDSPTLALPQFTIGAWVRVDAIDNVETMQIVWKGTSNGADVSTPYSLSVVGNNPFGLSPVHFGTPGPGKVLVILGDGTNEVDVFSMNALSLGTFHYVAVTADGQKINLYIDGVLDGNSPASESSLTLPFVTGNPLQIGGIQGGPAPGNNFDGVIDELQIWNRVLTAAEISGIFTTVGEYQPAARPAGLVSWWPAEGGYTDIISGNNGTPSGGMGFAPGEVGQAFSFSGGSAEITVPENPNLDVGQVTIEAWVKPTTSGHGRPIVQKRSSTNVGGYTFETTDMSDGPGPANGLQFGIWINGTLNLLQTPANALTIGAWQHVAATYDGSTMNIYVNGVLKASQAAPGSIDTDSADPLVMGLNVFNAGYDWNGFTDEVSLYNRGLTSTEIQSIVNAGGAGKAKP